MLITLMITFTFQVLVAFLGGEAVRVVSLSVEEHLLCLIFGSVSIVTNIIMKTFMPVDLIEKIEEA